jgi:hypothetical protein
MWKQIEERGSTIKGRMAIWLSRMAWTGSWWGCGHQQSVRVSDAGSTGEPGDRGYFRCRLSCECGGCLGYWDVNDQEVSLCVCVGPRGVGVCRCLLGIYLSEVAGLLTGD